MANVQGEKSTLNVKQELKSAAPWWKPSLPFLASGVDDQSKREECEARENARLLSIIYTGTVLHVHPRNLRPRLRQHAHRSTRLLMQHEQWERRMPNWSTSVLHWSFGRSFSSL